MRRKYTFLSFGDFQTLDPWFPPKYVTVSTTGASRPAKYVTVSATGACTVSRWPVCRSAQGNLIMTLYLIPGTQIMSLYLIPGPEKIQWHRTLQSTHCAVVSNALDVFGIGFYLSVGWGLAMKVGFSWYIFIYLGELLLSRKIICRAKHTADHDWS